MTEGDFLFGIQVFKPSNLVLRCLQNMKEFISSPVVVVDQTQNEKDIELLETMVRESNHPLVEILVEREDNNLLAINRTIELALERNCKYVVPTNFDILYLGTDFVPTMRMLMETNPRVGIIGPGTNKTSYDFIRIGGMPEIGRKDSIAPLTEWYKSYRTPPRARRTRIGDYHVMVIRTDTVKEVGLFDHKRCGRFGAFGEIDYGYRMELKNYYWAATNNPVVYHFGRDTSGGQTTHPMVDAIERIALENMEKKWGGAVWNEIYHRERGFVEER